MYAIIPIYGENVSFMIIYHLQYLRMKLVIGLLIFLAFPVINMAQDDNGLILGRTPKEVTAAVYDLSDPQGVNIEVSVWGFVRFPGRYIVPIKTKFTDLVSFAGGPMENSNLKEIKIIRNPVSGESKTSITKLDYNDYLWSENISISSKKNPELQSGDIILIPEEKRYTVREDVSFYLAIFTTLFTITTLIITLTNK